ncbi:ABC transporter permease subunit [Tolumonas lignilytica]|uniref:ABC transporter permease subunit n=1 Tax=Tolumonas lignilytica TaxID=1283284 RepID=UPI00046611E4|nr:ABC transporter permease subunit [Tolumonas lignilytica]
MPSKVRIYPEIRIPSPLAQTWQTFRNDPRAMTGLWLFAFFIGMALLGPSLASYDPFNQNANALLLPPSWETNGSLHYFLGTDDLGRDTLSRLLYGAQLTFGSALTACLLAMVFGSCIGIVAAMQHGLSSSILYHMLDILLSIPSLLLAIVLVSIMGASLDNALLAISLAQIPQFIRASFNAVREEYNKEYIIAVRLDGSTPFRILRLAILPNILDVLVTQTTRGLSAAILDISAVCFLGLGAQSPLSEWGTMIADSLDLAYISPWNVALPGLAIMLSVVATNLMGEGLRKALQQGQE